MRFTNLYLAPVSFDSRANVDYNIHWSPHWYKEKYGEDYSDDD
jgi:hypothetical protein